MKDCWRIRKWRLRLAGGTLVRNIGLSMSGQAMSMVASAVYVVLAARFFTKQEVAVLAITGIVTALLDVSKGLGLGTVVLKRVPQLAADRQGEVKGLVVTYWFYSLLPPLILGVASIGLAGEISSHFLESPRHGREVSAGLVAGIFTVASSVNLLLMQATHQFGWRAALTIVTDVVPRIAPFAITSGEGADFLRFLAWRAILSGAGFLATWVPMTSILRLPRATLLAPKDFWPESRHFYVTALLRYAATQIDQLLVAALFSPATLAVYYMLRRLYSVAALAIGSAIDAVLPSWSRDAGADQTGAHGRMWDWVRLAVYFGMVGGVWFAANGKALTAWVLGAGYAEDNGLLLLFAVSIVIYCPYQLAQVNLVLFREPGLSLRAALLTAGCNLALVVPLATQLGVRAAPAAMAASQAAGLLLSLHYLDSRFLAPSRLIPACGVAAAGGLLAALTGESGGDWPALVAGNLLIGLFAWFAYTRWNVGTSLRRIN